VELCPLVLVVSGTLPPCVGGQWNFAPLCWWSVELCPLCWWSVDLCPLVLVVSGPLPLVLVVSGTLPSCVAAVNIYVNVWVVFL
ncbi:unnamed protein product, partial [Staurois parvus]